MRRERESLKPELKEEKHRLALARPRLHRNFNGRGYLALEPRARARGRGGGGAGGGSGERERAIRPAGLLELIMSLPSERERELPLPVNNFGDLVKFPRPAVRYTLTEKNCFPPLPTYLRY